MKRILIAVLFLTEPYLANTTLFAYESGMPDPRTTCQRFDLKNQPDEAVKCYKEVARANPTSPESQYFLGVAYVWAGDEKSTRKQYQLLRKMDYGSAYLLIDTIYHVKPQWFDDYYQKETEKLVEIEKQMQEQLKHLEPSPEELTNGFEAHSRPQRVNQELAYLQYAQDALSRNDPESAYRLIEDGLVSDYDEVRESFVQFIEQNPDVREGARRTFRPALLEESIRKYGQEARGLVIHRLSSYKTVASDVDYSAARQNAVEIFGEID